MLDNSTIGYSIFVGQKDSGKDFIVIHKDKNDEGYFTLYFTDKPYSIKLCRTDLQEMSSAIIAALEIDSKY